MAKRTNGVAKRVVLVTGGSRGIGAAVGWRLARDGYRVYFSYLQDHAGADAQVRRIRAEGGHAFALQRNLADADEAASLVRDVAAAEGRIDALVCSAASGVFRALGDFTPRQWRWTLDVNARAFLLLVQDVAPLMRAQGGGRVVALTSQGARAAIPLYSLVGASKGALEALVRHCAAELGPSGVTVNAVSPGLVLTDGVRAFIEEAEAERVRQRVPLGRLVEPEDVARLVSFLCGPDSAMISGSVIAVDGGYGVVA